MALITKFVEFFKFKKLLTDKNNQRNHPFACCVLLEQEREQINRRKNCETVKRENENQRSQFGGGCEVISLIQSNNANNDAHDGCEDDEVDQERRNPKHETIRAANKLKQLRSRHAFFDFHVDEDRGPIP